jgi:acyl-CoA thioesterase-1
MSVIAFHFASGAAFFTGVVCLLVGTLAILLGVRRWNLLCGRILFVLGFFAVGTSATPLPVWVYTLWVSSFLVWAGFRYRPAALSGRWRALPIAVWMACILAATFWELCYQWPPSKPTGSWDKLIVIGDSISAADFSEGGDPWPYLLARDHGIRVENLAFSGAQAKSAAKHVAGKDLSRALVLLEIGGNDLLGETSKADFDRDLDQLLALVVRPDNAVVMLELPLPPLYNNFGAVQRRLSAKNHVHLIPKRYFADVIADPQNRVDGIHLSATGHQKMSDMIWHLISPSISHSAFRTPHSAFPP